METYFAEEFDDVALAVLQEHPECSFEEWTDALSSQFPLEIIDAFGCNEAEVKALLREWWERQATLFDK